jgi:hypothetical protein
MLEPLSLLKMEEHHLKMEEHHLKMEEDRED